MVDTQTITVTQAAHDYLDERRSVQSDPAISETLTTITVERTKRVQAARFVESAAGTYEWAVALEAGTIIHNIGLIAEAVWDAATSASMEVGIVGDDEDTFFTAVDLKATDLTLGQSVDFAKTGGVEGASASGTATHWDDRYSGSTRTVSFTAVSVGAGTAGRTIAYIEYSVPTMQAPTLT